MQNSKLQLRIPEFKQAQELKSGAGFTIIELIVAFSILAVISTIGVIAFVSYSQIQAVNAGGYEVVTMFQTAKSRAQSQVKPNTGACSVLPLYGYEVVLCPGGCNVGYKYRLNVLCGDGGGTSQTIETKKLPKDVYFSGFSSETYFLFRSLTGGLEHPGFSLSPQQVPVILQRRWSGETKTITIYQDGRITVQ